MQPIITGKYALSLRTSKANRKAWVIWYYSNGHLLIDKGKKRSALVLAVVRKWACKWLAKIVQVVCKW
jgi:hypothetical protein